MEEDKGKGKTRSCEKCGEKIASGIKFSIFKMEWTVHIFCRNRQCDHDNSMTLSFKPLVIVGAILIIIAIGMRAIEISDDPKYVDVPYGE